MLQKTITIPATLQDVSKFTGQLDLWFDSLAMEIRVGVVLAVQELCVNIVEHAYDGKAGEIRIEIDWTPSQLQLHFTDQAPNHLTMPDVISAPDPFMLQEGGMGLFLIHQAFDDVEYTPTCDENHWRLVKRLV
jgi:anti-sigma regulatory factor (Ser/Thr protein kinase)